MSDNNAFLWNHMGPLSKAGGGTSKHFQEGVKQMQAENFSAALKAFEKAAAETSNPECQAALLVLCGNALAGLGNITKAIACYTEAEQNAIISGDRECRVVALHNMGALEKSRGGLGLAEEILDKAMNLAAEGGNARGQADIYDLLGDIALVKSENEKAYKHFSAALELERGMNDTIGMAYHLTCLAHMFHVEGELDKAVEKYQEALSLNESVEDEWGEANCLDRLSSIYTEIHETEEAAACNARALELFIQLGDNRGEAGAHLTRGVIAAMEDDTTTALEEIEKALTMFSSMGDLAAQANCFYELAGVHFNYGDLENAEILFKKALKGYEDSRLRANQADAFSSLGRIQLDRGDFAGAKELFLKGIALSLEDGDDVGEANSLQYLANACFYLKEYDEAMKHLRRSREIYTRSGDVEGMKMAEKNINWVERNTPKT